MRVAACVAAVLVVSVAEAQQQVEQPQHDLCEPIRGPLCLQVPYNRTAMPNLLNQHKQEDAALELSKYGSLMKLHCSPHLEIFLCAIFLPLCTPLERPLYPCRSLCESVVTSCSNMMQAGRYDWQPVFDCDTYPDWPEMCLGENMTRPRAGGATGSAPGRGPPARAPPPGRAPAVRDLGFVCPVQFKVPRSLEYSLRVGSKVEPDCGAPCHAMFFSEQQRRFARAWVGAWAALCSASCLFTVLTFLIDMQRFRYPERPIIFLSVCYLMVAATYVAGVAAGDSVACREPFPPPDGLRVQTVSTVTQGTKHELCTILFMLLYFFGMASSIWWVVLTLTWFLAAGLKWGHEAIEANSQYFHLAAWAVPAVKTITILAMGKVDGDVLSGVCYVGVLNVEALRGFVVAPLCAYLALGTVFLLAGFVALFRIRTVMKHDGTRTDKLEKLMIRIGTFSVLYTVPALIVLACLLYEQAHFDLWMESWRDDMCARRQYAMPCPPGATSPRRTHKPEFEVFMIKYLMCMIVGITSSFWTWSGKTLHSWRCFLNRIRGRKDEAYV